MTILVEGARVGEFLIMELPEKYSRETVTVDATGGALESGQVLGEVGGVYVPYDETASDGSEVVAGILHSHITEAVSTDAVVVNDIAKVKVDRLIFTGTEATVLAGLAAINIKSRA